MPLKINMAGGYSSDFCQFIVVIPSEFGTVGINLPIPIFFKVSFAEYGISVITGSAAVFGNFAALIIFFCYFIPRWYLVQKKYQRI